jgi:hypothetical protein
MLIFNIKLSLAQKPSLFWLEPAMLYNPFLPANQ